MNYDMGLQLYVTCLKDNQRAVGRFDHSIRQGTVNQGHATQVCVLLYYGVSVRFM